MKERDINKPPAHAPIWAAGLIVACLWISLFLPRLLPGLSIKAVAWVFISAFLMSPILYGKRLRNFGITLISVVGAVDIFYVYYFGTLSDEYLIATILRTNTQEAADFWKTLPILPSIGALAWLVYTFIVGKFLGNIFSLGRGISHIALAVGCLALIAWLGIGMVYLAAGATQKVEVELKVRNVYPVHMVWAMVKQKYISDAVVYEPVAPKAQRDAQKIPLVVAVIGESATSQRWSLLGYQGADTNNELNSISGTTILGVMARGFATVSALPYVMTGFSTEQSIKDKLPSFLDLAKFSGYKVFVFDNSRSFGGGDFFGQILRRSTDVYKKVGNGDHDGILTSWLEGAVKDAAPYKLIVLHTFGSHEIVTDRYPKEFDKTRDPYDNSIVYTSHLLRHWIDILGAADKASVLLYTSDHGLSMPPCSPDYIHKRSMSSLEVPFLMYGNRAAHDEYPEFFHIDDEHDSSNALLGQKVVEGVGYRRLVQEGVWPKSGSPVFENRRWSELKRLDACSLS